MCFFAGGVKFSEQGFAFSASQINSSLLILSVTSVILPSVFHLAVDNTQPQGSAARRSEGRDILAISHGFALILLFVYVSYLAFQLFSHRSLYDEENPVNLAASTAYPARDQNTPTLRERFRRVIRGSINEVSALSPRALGRAPMQSNSEEHDLSAFGHGPLDPEQALAGQINEDTDRHLSLTFTVILLIVVTTLVSVTAECLVDSIDGLTRDGGVSKEFVGIILLPIVGNAAEHVTAVTVSVKDKLTLSLGVAVGSSIQIALFVIPFMVTLAWIIGKPLTLLLDTFESAVLFFAVLTVNYVVQDGKSNWLEGVVLMCECRFHCVWCQY